MTENDITAIRNGITQYVGALQNVVDKEGLEKNQYIVGVLMDEIVETARINMDSPYCNPFILMPLFNVMQGILVQQVQVMQREEQTEETKHHIARFKAMCGELDYLMQKSLEGIQAKED